MMTSRQRVHKALEFDRPDRVPRNLWQLPIAQAKYGAATMEAFKQRWPDDFSGPGVPNKALRSLCRGDAHAIGQYVDEWGCVFENVQAGVIGEVKQPLLEDWSRLDDLRLPVEAFQIDRAAVNRACAQSDKFVQGGCCPRPFERMQFLRGSENLYMDLAEMSSEVCELLGRVHSFFRQELELWAKTDVDALVFMDDWGAQNALLIDPALWRRMFKPLYAEYAQIAHDAGKKILMHSDGHIAAIYEDLIEIGIDAINSQLFCMDIEELGRRYAGRITFWGEIDRQHVLPHGTCADASAAVKRVVENLYQPAGGVIAQFELGPGAKLENAEAIYQTWQDLTEE
jgi:uroporphyrinogen decarboxylase